MVIFSSTESLFLVSCRTPKEHISISNEHISCLLAPWRLGDFNSKLIETAAVAMRGWTENLSHFVDKKGSHVNKLELLRTSFSSVMPTFQSSTSPELLPIAGSYTQFHAAVLAKAPDIEVPGVCLMCGAILDAAGRGQCCEHVKSCCGDGGIIFLLQVLTTYDALFSILPFSGNLLICGFNVCRIIPYCCVMRSAVAITRLPLLTSMGNRTRTLKESPSI